MSYVIIDTGFLVALFNEQDQLHCKAFHAAEKYENRQWVSSLFTIQETFWLLSNKSSRAEAERFLSFADHEIDFPSLPSDWLCKVQRILKKYGSAKIDLADASLVMLAEYISTGDILTGDRRDFDILRWGSQNNAFNNLLFQI